jgi:hypothetical protein
MVPFVWFLLGGAAGAALTAKAAVVVGTNVAFAGAGAGLAAVAAVRKKLSPQAQFEFDTAFAGLTPEEVLAVVNNDRDADATRISQIARQHLAHRKQWLAMLQAKNFAASSPAPLHATAGAWVGHYATGAARGGPILEFLQWAKGNPEFLAWAQRQGSGWTSFLEFMAETSFDQRQALAYAYSVQMNYMRQRWPDGMLYLNSALADGTRSQRPMQP